MLMNLTRRRATARESTMQELKAPIETSDSTSASLAHSVASPETPPPIAAKAGQGLRTQSKAAAVLEHLRSPAGASLRDLMITTGWKAHSVRGFLSSTIRKKMGLTVLHVAGADQIKRYRIVEAAAVNGTPMTEPAADRPEPDLPASGQVA